MAHPSSLTWTAFMTGKGEPGSTSFSASSTMAALAESSLCWRRWGEDATHLLYCVCTCMCEGVCRLHLQMWGITFDHDIILCSF